MFAGRRIVARSVGKAGRRVRNKQSTRSMGGGAMPYNEPGGNLFNEVATTKTRTWESWEYGYWSTCVAGLIFGTVGLAVRPDSSIKTWATKEAKARNSAGVYSNANLGEAYTLTHGFKVSSIGAIPIRGGGDEDEDDE